MMSFRLTLTACVMVIIGLLAALLIFVQVRTLDLVTEDAATSTMASASRATISSFQVQVEMLSRMTRALSFTPAIMDTSDPGDASPTARLIKGNLGQWPALDSIYVGYDNGYWLQVERLDGMGTFSAAGTPWLIDHQRPIPLGRPPRLGQDNEYVFKSVLGLDEVEYAALMQTQVIY